MRKRLIQSWPVIRAYLWGWILASCFYIPTHLMLAQRQHHHDVRQAINAVSISWEVCRASEGLPAKHAHGGAWIRTNSLSRADLERTESIAGDWAWTDNEGKLTAWPGREDDASNSDEDVCSESWRAGRGSVE